MPVGLAGFTCSLPVLPAAGGVCGVDGPVFVCAITEVPATTPAAINAGKKRVHGHFLFQYVQGRTLVAAAAGSSRRLKIRCSKMLPPAPPEVPAPEDPEPLGLVSTPGSVELVPAPETPLLVPLLEGAPSMMVLKFPRRWDRSWLRSDF